MRKELPKNYNPKEFEKRLYSYWMENGYFHAETDDNRPKYSIAIPPPNITGQLHMGHALMVTIQDILIRHKRMQGYAAMWMPGTDHASIATEARIVRTLLDEGTSKEEIGREKYLERAWDWRNKYGNRINLQLRELGASLDWERERFTLDEGCNKAVNEVFIKLYEEGLIYRAKRLVNWCPDCVTALSDAEVDHDDRDGNFWHFLYPLEDGSGNVEIATTRPETMLGDTAVAVNPDDERYKQLVGKNVILPLVGRKIPIIADSYVDSEFGTGVVKITPAHDPNDYEVGLRHNLPQEMMLTEEGLITDNYKEYAGLKRFDARKKIVADMDKAGLLVNTKVHNHSVGVCSRCSSVVEPMLSLEWFVKMESLAKPAIDVVKSGELKLVPPRFEKSYMNWLDNIKDWCISRRLWWGHRIPAYHCSCGETIVSKIKPEKCSSCGHEVHQDESTLDTWFSSALWPFSTLGWPDKTADLEKFFPTDTLVTGYDIIFFWVIRMVFSSLHNTGKIPFERVLFTGIVRDEQGRKMSKSLDNGIDPLEIIEEYGADALRMSLILGTTPGTDMRVSFDKIKYCRNLANKLWNASRFLMMYIEDDTPCSLPDFDKLSITDRWTLHHYFEMAKSVEDHMQKLDVALAAAKVEDFLWNVFCDFTIEFSKIVFNGDNEEQKTNQKQFLLYILRGILSALHPFMPFVTEEIYQSIPSLEGTIMLQEYPKYDEKQKFEKVHEVDVAIEIVKAVRNLRSERNIPPKQAIDAVIETEIDLSGCTGFIKRFCNITPIDSTQGEVVTLVVTDAKVVLPLSGFIDTEKERQRLEKELASAKKEVDFLSAKLQNKSFVDKAPQHLVQQQKDKLSVAEQRLKDIENSIIKL